MKWHRTIRFKLTLWYSLLFIISNFVFVLVAGAIITQHYQDKLPRFLENDRPNQMIGAGPRQMEEFEDFEEFEALMEETREQDRKQVQRILFFVFFILSGFSCASGYVVAGRMLKPLKKINKTTKKINAENLHTQIEHEDLGDEVSEMIGNINAMIGRLNKSFSLQKQFVENASHELKTPLAIIRTNLDSLVLNKELSSEEREQYLGQAIKSTKFMNKLIEDLLLLSLVDRDIKVDKLEVREVLTEAVNQVKVLADQKEIKLDFKPEANLSRKISGNNALLQRAFMNIMENAINYSKDKGEVIVKAGLNKDQKAVIEIIDNGVGIPKDKIDKIFDRFYRVDKSRSRKTGGTGLGLAITKKIIDLHQGVITIDSEENLGTQVKIIF